MHQRLEQPCGVTPAGGERGFRWRGFLGLRLPDREQRGRHARRHIAWTDRPFARNNRARALGGSSGACAIASAPGLSKPAQRSSTFGAYFRVDDHYGICSVSLWDHWLPHDGALLDDGKHLTRQGGSEVADAIAPLLAAAWMDRLGWSRAQRPPLHPHRTQ